MICRRWLIGEWLSNLDLTDYIPGHLAQKYLTRESHMGPNETSLKIRPPRLDPARKYLGEIFARKRSNLQLNYQNIL